MKKTLIIIVNVIIMAAILIFVVQYSRFESRDSYNRQIEHFENTTVTMEKVTENYLEGEQRICDVWSQYINNRKMTLEEAAGYIRSSHVLENTSAHLILLDTLTGLSTRPKLGTDDDYAVSYVGIRGDEDRDGYISSKPNIQAIFPFRKNIWSIDVINKFLHKENLDQIVDIYEKLCPEGFLRDEII